MWVRSDNGIGFDSRRRVLVIDVPPHPEKKVEYHKEKHWYEQQKTEAKLRVSRSERSPGEIGSISTYTDKRDQVNDSRVLGQ